MNTETLLEEGLDHQRAGRVPEASRCFREVLQREPDNADAAYSLGRILETNEEWPEAVDCYDIVLGRNPEFVPARLSRSVCLQALGRLDEAAEDCRIVLAREPANVAAGTNLGICFMTMQRLADAERVLRDTLDKEPGYTPARLNLAATLRATGRPADAVAELERIANTEAKDAAVLYMLGAARFETGAKESARDALLEAYAMNPYDRRTLAMLAVLLPELEHYGDAEQLVDYGHLLQTFDVATPEGYRSLDEFNRALAEHVMNHQTLEYERAANTTKGGWHTGNLLIGDKGPCETFEHIINARVRDYFAALPRSDGHVYLGWQPSDWRLSLWGVVLESSGHQNPHIHPDGWLSGVYYLQVPDCIGDDNDAAGFLEFGRGRTEWNVTNESMIRLVQPKEGQMVLFPSYYYHRTVPFESEQKRICVAFDIRPIV